MLVLGPGRALLAIASTPRPHIVHLVEVVVGVVVLVAAVVLWLKREGFARRLSAHSDRTRFSPLALGAVIIVAEFPTALPYSRRWLRSSRRGIDPQSGAARRRLQRLLLCADPDPARGGGRGRGAGRAFAQAARDRHSTVRRDRSFRCCSECWARGSWWSAWPVCAATDSRRSMRFAACVPGRPSRRARGRARMEPLLPDSQTAQCAAGPSPSSTATPPCLSSCSRTSSCWRSSTTRGGARSGAPCSQRSR